MTVTDKAIGLTSSPSDYAKVIVDMIEAGQVDPYLRLLFDVIVDRKKALEHTESGLPAQWNRHELPSDEVIAHVFEAGYIPPTPGITVTVGEPRPAFNPPPADPPAAPKSVIPTDPKHYRRKKAPPTQVAPDKAIQPFTGTIPPLTPAQQQDSAGHDPMYQITLNGKVYDKRAIKGNYVDYEVEGIPVRFKIVGIGPKAVQGLLVFSPMDLGYPNLAYRGRLLQQAFTDTKPVYLPHAAIAGWLG